MESKLVFWKKNLEPCLLYSIGPSSYSKFLLSITRILGITSKELVFIVQTMGITQPTQFPLLSLLLFRKLTVKIYASHAAGK